MGTIIELDEALDIVRREARSARRRPTVTVLLDGALGRVLAAEVISPIDSPPFDKSAMDGFALAAGDTSQELRVRDTLPAGRAAASALRKGECARIMTGAMLPPGADRVVRKEFVEERDGAVRILRAELGDNVVRRGASLKRGEPVLGPRVLSAQDIGILAASGIAEAQVAVPPSVGIICTGPEIRAPGEPLGPGQIYNSNGPQLGAQLAAMGCPGRQRGTAPDEPGPLAGLLASALSEHDVVILTGGVSVGDFDYVPRCLQEKGAQVFFHGVAVKPGKPTLFARRGSTAVFGLPGNPVSTFVIFELFVKPYLYGTMGLDWQPAVFRCTLGEAVRRKATERTEFLPVRVRGGVVTPVAFHGSADLNALGEADGLVRVERGVAEIPRGEQIDVRPI